MARDSFSVDLANAGVGGVRGQITERSELLGKHVKISRQECHVVGVQDIPMGTKVIIVVKLPATDINRML